MARSLTQTNETQVHGIPLTIDPKLPQPPKKAEWIIQAQPGGSLNLPYIQDWAVSLRTTLLPGSSPDRHDASAA
jgi:hypothetical protein